MLARYSAAAWLSGPFTGGPDVVGLIPRNAPRSFPAAADTRGRILCLRIVTERTQDRSASTWFRARGPRLDRERDLPLPDRRAHRRRRHGRRLPCRGSFARPHG